MTRAPASGKSRKKTRPSAPFDSASNEATATQDVRLSQAIVLAVMSWHCDARLTPLLLSFEERDVRFVVRLAAEEVRQRSPARPSPPPFERTSSRHAAAVVGLSSPSFLKRVSTSRESESAHW